MNLLGFYGKSGTGKSACAEMMEVHLQDYFQRVVRMGFADPIAWEIADSCLGRVEVLRANKSLPLIRKLFQWWGDQRRAEDPSYFIRRLDVRYKILNPQTSFALVDDVRYQEEVDYFHEKGGVVVEVRKNSIEYEREDWRKHPTETSKVTGIDFVLQNNLCLDNLRFFVKNLFLKLEADYGFIRPRGIEELKRCQNPIAD